MLGDNSTKYTPIMTATIVPARTHKMRADGEEVDIRDWLVAGLNPAIVSATEWLVRTYANEIEFHGLKYLEGCGSETIDSNNQLMDRLIGFNGFEIGLVTAPIGPNDLPINPTKLVIKARVPYTELYSNQSWALLFGEGGARGAFCTFTDALVRYFADILPDIYAILDDGKTVCRIC